MAEALSIEKYNTPIADIMESIEDIIKSYNGEIIEASNYAIVFNKLIFNNTNIIQKVYEIPNHGAIIGKFSLDKKPKIQFKFENQIFKAHIVLTYVGFKENDEVYTGLKTDLSIFQQ